jgi:hypothetical protein
MCWFATQGSAFGSFGSGGAFGSHVYRPYERQDASKSAGYVQK